MKSNCIIAFAGHMIDRNDRIAPRFPPYIEPAVRMKIRKTIEYLNPAAAISSAACGGDIIFAEEMLAYGALLYVILPFEDREDFIFQSVASAGPGWIERFEGVCSQAIPAPYFVKPGNYESDQDFEANQRALVFFALGVAAASNSSLKCLILCDEQQLGNQIGGTRSFLELCQGLNIPYEIIDLAAIRLEHMRDTDMLIEHSPVQPGGTEAHNDHACFITRNPSYSSIFQPQLPR
ncbi:MAG: hypothetical protein MI924_16980 [Chloroflexales bacterium]|nr:hypothetical protein [Chloroflexales bacterium]